MFFSETLRNFYLQTLDIVAENPGKFRVVALAAGSNVTLLADQVTMKFLLMLLNDWHIEDNFL